MFARVLEFVPKAEKREEFIRLIKKEVLPILKKQYGFLEILPLVPETKTEKMLTVTLWNQRLDFERYERDWFPKVEQMIQPYLITPIVVHNLYAVETAICEHFEKMFAA